MHVVPSFAPRSGAGAAAALCALVVASCRTAAPLDTQADLGSAEHTGLPAWLLASADVARGAELEEAAAFLCARDTDGLIDDDARHATGIADGQVLGMLRRADTLDAARSALAMAAGPLLDEKRVTHAGVALGTTPAGQACAAVVGVRRLVERVGPRPAGRLARSAAQHLTVRVPPERTATLYVLRPDGFVTRTPLQASEAKLALRPDAGEGRYVAEVVVDDAQGPSDPQVALVWPWIVGAPREAPFPEVLFPDEGHDDAALTHRAESLLQRLRNEQLLEPFKLSPALGTVALERGQAVARRGAVGHRVEGPRGATDAMQDVKARFPDDARARFVRLAEVQAQASTLADAWRALLDSPAHRFVLVDSAFTHAAAAVVRGHDAASRPTVTLLALVARRPPQRDLDAVRAQLFELANNARTERGFDALTESVRLHRVAQRLAEAMKDNHRLDETLLGGPVGQVALEADASFTRVRPLVARIDDPLLLAQGGPPALLMDMDVTALGVGFALDPADGAFYVVLLAGE